VARELGIDAKKNVIKSTAVSAMPLGLAAGLDDIATERQLTSGWSFIVLPKGEVAQLAAKAQALLPSGVLEFHAAELKTQNRSHCQAYEDFLYLLRKTAEAAPGCLLASTLNNQTWHHALTSFAARIVTNVFGTVGVTDSDVVKGAVEAAPSLVTMVRLLKTPSAVLSSLEIDESTNMGRFGVRSIVARDVSMQATELLARVVDGYRKLGYLNDQKSDSFPAFSTCEPGRRACLQSHGLIGLGSDRSPSLFSRAYLASSR
jgi:hypothetical protein